MNGAYDLEGVIYHQHSNKLMKKILELFKKHHAVIDIGCGHNFYVQVLEYAGYMAVGCDLVDLGYRHFFMHDVTKPIHDIYKPATVGTIVGHMDASKVNVISLEVGEHIPDEEAGGYLDNLCAFNGDVIMSWAVPGQAGVGHINCQTNDWVRDQMAQRGYSLCPFRTKELRIAVNGCHCTWFADTLMYFHPIPEA